MRMKYLNTTVLLLQPSSNIEIEVLENFRFCQEDDNKKRRERLEKALNNVNTHKFSTAL